MPHTRNRRLRRTARRKAPYAFPESDMNFTSGAVQPPSKNISQQTIFRPSDPYAGESRVMDAISARPAMPQSPFMQTVVETPPPMRRPGAFTGVPGVPMLPTASTPAPYSGGFVQTEKGGLPLYETMYGQGTFGERTPAERLALGRPNVGEYTGPSMTDPLEAIRLWATGQRGERARLPRRRGEGAAEDRGELDENLGPMIDNLRLAYGAEGSSGYQPDRVDAIYARIARKGGPSREQIEPILQQSWPALFGARGISVAQGAGARPSPFLQTIGGAGYPGPAAPPNPYAAYGGLNPNVDIRNAAQLFGGAVAGNPFITPEELARMQAGYAPLEQGINPAFYRYTSPVIQQAMAGLRQSVGYRPEDAQFAAQQWTPASLF